jgi:PAS domain S-box-containing protein
MKHKERADLCSRSQAGAFCRSRKLRTDCCVILDSITDGVFAVDREFRIVSFFNRAAEQITGYSIEEAVGQYCFDIFRSAVCQAKCPLKHTMTTKEPVYDYPSVIINKAGAEISISISTALILDDRGELMGGVEIFRDLSVVETLRNVISGRYRMRDLISKNHRMQDIFEILPDVAESDSTVLIQGPSGSGKEVVATAIHDLSLRKDQPFIKINCGAIPDTLLESELFGYVKGAFTDARKDKPGRFLLANHGTVFLDEIGDTSPALQVKLLRVLEEKQFVPLGGTAPVKVDVRIIAASHKDVEKLVRLGSFRDDLYYRLNIIKIQLPPLRERKEDIPLLVEHFISRLKSVKGKNISAISEEVLDLLMNYQFPGNIRELENILEHAYVLAKDPIIEKKHLPLDFLEKAWENRGVAGQLKLLECSEAEAIQEVLQKHDGCRITAARELGLSRATLWRKIKKYQLD